MKLIHLANCGSSNIGNGALILGLERVLQEDFGGQIDFVRHPWDDYSQGYRKFDEGFVDFVNQSDGLIVGAAVTFNAHSRNSNAGMRFDLPLHLWDKIIRPIVFYGLSFRSWPYMRYISKSTLTRTMARVLQNPRIMFSVRNDGTKNWLESLLGYQSDKIVPVPDPATYVPVTDSWHPEPAQGKVNLLISLDSEDEARRFSGLSADRTSRYWPPYRMSHLLRLWKALPPWSFRKTRFLENLAAVLDKLFDEVDLNIILCVHAGEDHKMGVELSSLCSRRVSYHLTSSSHLRVPMARYFYDLYTKVDVALCMRVHSMAPAVGLGAPLVALVSQTRMHGYMTDADLNDFAIDIFDPHLRHNLYSKIIQLIRFKEEAKRKLQGARAAMRERTAAYNQRVFSFLQQHRSS